MNTLFLYSEENHIIAEQYNTTRIVFKNGTEKLKKTSFAVTKGLLFTNQHNGTLSEEKLDYKTKQYLKKVRTNIIDLAFNYSFWEYFITLTFDFRKVGEYTHEKAIELLKKWINNQKHQNPSMIYLLVPEFHKESGHIHFHGLIANVPKWRFSEARNPRTNGLIKVNGLQIYNLDNYKLGFTTISIVQDQEKVSNYISKYATKDLITLKNKKRYWYSRNLEKPKVSYSYETDNLKDVFNLSDDDYYQEFQKVNCSIEIAQKTLKNKLPIIDR